MSASCTASCLASLRAGTRNPQLMHLSSKFGGLEKHHWHVAMVQI